MSKSFAGDIVDIVWSDRRHRH